MIRLPARCEVQNPFSRCSHYRRDGRIPVHSAPARRGLGGPGQNPRVRLRCSRNAASRVGPPTKQAPLEPANRSAQSVLSAETVTIASSDIGRADRPFPISSVTRSLFLYVNEGPLTISDDRTPSLCETTSSRPKTRTQSTPWRYFLFLLFGWGVNFALPFTGAFNFDLLGLACRPNGSFDSLQTSTSKPCPAAYHRTLTGPHDSRVTLLRAGFLKANLPKLPPTNDRGQKGERDDRSARLPSNPARLRFHYHHHRLPPR